MGLGLPGCLPVEPGTCPHEVGQGASRERVPANRENSFSPVHPDPLGGLGFLAGESEEKQQPQVKCDQFYLKV